VAIAVHRPLVQMDVAREDHGRVPLHR
jgi:hypothetical protein